MIRKLYGLTLCVLVGTTLLFVLPLVAVVAEGQTRQNLGLVFWCIGALLVGISFLNMSIFFLRLKRANQSRYLDTTRGIGFLGYVGESGRSLLTNLHRQTATIAADQSGVLPLGILLHAKVSLYLNRFGISYVFAGVLAIWGLILWTFILS